jgi:hypothetical protein
MPPHQNVLLLIPLSARLLNLSLFRHPHFNVITFFLVLHLNLISTPFSIAFPTKNFQFFARPTLLVSTPLSPLSTKTPHLPLNILSSFSLF